jgi:adenine phosphoribosyltransferase
MGVERIAAAVRDIPDFPKPGIVFKDISPILQDPDLFRLTVDTMADRYVDADLSSVAVIDARGFLFGSALAYKLGTGLSLIRKAGKLPYSTESIDYDLEYGSYTVEIHVDAIGPGDRVILVDDLLATGGTAAAAVHLINQLDGNLLAAEFVIELGFLNGRDRLDGCEVNALITY